MKTLAHELFNAQCEAGMLESPLFNPGFCLRPNTFMKVVFVASERFGVAYFIVVGLMCHFFLVAYISWCMPSMVLNPNSWPSFFAFHVRPVLCWPHSFPNSTTQLCWRVVSSSSATSLCWLSVASSSATQLCWPGVSSRSISINHEIIETHTISDKQQEALRWEGVTLPRGSRNLSTDKARR